MAAVTEANRKWWVLAGTSAGLFLLMLDSTVVALALPSIQADIDASNGLNTAFDASQTSATGLDLSLPANPLVAGNVTIDTTTGFNMAAGVATLVDPDGSNVVVPAQVIPQTGAPEILVLKVRSFKLLAGRTIVVSGSRALAIASHFDVYIAGTIDVSAVGGTVQELPARPGAGASTRVTARGVASGGGTWGGGGNATAGSSGAGSTMASPGGQAISTAGLQPLEGGGGGDGEYIYNGGGAIQISSRTRVAMASTSLIDVGGAGGQELFFGGWFVTGGGAGGGVLIEAPATQFTPGAIIAGRGGSGGASNSNANRNRGLDGPTTGTSPAGTVTCSGCGTSGAGGTESVAPTNATGSGVALGSGGGSVGRCVVRNAGGAVTPPAGMMKISFQTPPTLPPRP